MSSTPTLERTARDKLEHIEALARALSDLPLAALANPAARRASYLAAGLMPDLGHALADDAAASTLARTYRDLYPGARRARPVVLDACGAFAGRRAFAAAARQAFTPAAATTAP